MSEPIRINKYLAQHGYCSRREADRLIEQGKIFVNDKEAGLGDKISDGDDVRVIGRDRKTEPKKVYILLNKPIGLICTADPRSPDNVVDYIDFPDRIYPVGRLDVNSSGLLLLSNDGVLTNRLLHPRYEHEKEYVVEVDHEMPRSDIGKMQIGVDLSDGRTSAAKVRQMTPTKFAIILKEGRNRQIRRMCAELGYEVVSLMRTRMGTLKIPTTYPIGSWRHLSEREVRDLKKMVGLTIKKEVHAKRKKRKR
jgi:23S rRNA pseudouridine2604 synthase